MTQTLCPALAIGQVIRISMPQGDREGTLDGVVVSVDGAIVKVTFDQWVEEWHDDELTYDRKRDVWEAVGAGHVTEPLLV